MFVDTTPIPRSRNERWNALLTKGIDLRGWQVGTLASLARRVKAYGMKTIAVIGGVYHATRTFPSANQLWATSRRRMS